MKRKVSCVLIVRSHCEFIWSINIISPLLSSLPSLRFSDTEYPNWWIIPLDNSREASSHHSAHNILIRFRYIGAHLNDIIQTIGAREQWPNAGCRWTEHLSGLLFGLMWNKVSWCMSASNRRWLFGTKPLLLGCKYMRAEGERGY